jgi:hypothetical protein
VRTNARDGAKRHPPICASRSDRGLLDQKNPKPHATLCREDDALTLAVLAGSP